jgi:hypothetical protein
MFIFIPSNSSGAVGNRAISFLSPVEEEKPAIHKAIEKVD